MISLIAYFDCGTYIERNEGLAGDFCVTKFSDITQKIIPFFTKYPIVGVKALDFSDFSRVAELMQEKKHLTQPGLDQILNIKEGMNTGRTN